MEEAESLNIFRTTGFMLDKKNAEFILVDDDKNELEHIKSLLNEIVEDDKEICCFSKVTTELKQEIQNTDSRKVYVLDIR